MMTMLAPWEHKPQGNAVADAARSSGDDRSSAGEIHVFTLDASADGERSQSFYHEGCRYDYLLAS